MAEIYLAGGCFWGTEHFLKLINGVLCTEVGYANGRTENPSYQQVCKENTGHAETVKVVYDENRVSLDKILSLFYNTIDPTSLNKQGEDEGTQYRTGIYYVNDDDLSVINTSIAELAKQYDKPVLIEVCRLQNFYKAEEYHQDYLHKNPTGYCHINPKLFDLAKNAK